jgi:hypothetical protein
VVAGVALALACVAELSMKFSPVAVGPKQQSCSDCSIRRLSICALLDQDEMREIEDLVRHVRFAACETVFAQEDNDVVLQCFRGRAASLQIAA